MAAVIELAVNQGEAADAKRFFTLGLALVDLLNSLSEDDTLAWRIADLRIGSAIATIEPSDPHTDEAERVISSLDRGIEQMRTGNADALDWAPDTRKQAKSFFSEADEHTILSYKTNQATSTKRIAITPNLKAEIESLEGVSMSYFGSVRGKLTGVNINKGFRASIAPFNGNPTIQVTFPEDQAETYKDLLFGHVTIEGTVHKKRNSPPNRIDAKKISQIHETNVTWMQLRGVMPEITEGKSVKEYLEDIRGEAG